MRQHLLQWQWELYPDGHKRRLTLAVHLASAPLFVSGVLMLATSALAGWYYAVAGAAFMIATLVIQGWTHKQEDAKPIPFLGPMDFVSRFFVEQFVTFPRFVFSGSFAQAWRSAR
ncbi:MAG TPA: hypothetical protein VGH28_21075 [Polyangiaceae bacterium]|jgi:hypothetical protein